MPFFRDFHCKQANVIQILIEFIHDIDSVIVDGIGIGSEKKTNLNWMRGTQVGERSYKM